MSNLAWSGSVGNAFVCTRMNARKYVKMCCFKVETMRAGPLAGVSTEICVSADQRTTALNHTAYNNYTHCLYICCIYYPSKVSINRLLSNQKSFIYFIIKFEFIHVNFFQKN